MVLPRIVRPDRAVFNDFEAFENYLDAHASAGDVIHVWSFASVGTVQQYEESDDSTEGYWFNSSRV